MDCRRAQPLIPSYLDGELSEASAAPLRRHLLDCQPCRAGAQGEKNLKRWFAPTAAVSVPQGFAAHVARRAFAGDAGELDLAYVLPSASGSSREPSRDLEGRLLRFVLELTAAAALLVIVLSVALRSLSVPAGTSLRAADGRGEIGVEEAIERLDALNREEAREDPAPAPGARRP